MAELSDIGDEAAAQTDQEFAAQLSKYTQRDAAEVQKLFPTREDQKELLDLMRLVNEAAASNERKAKFIEGSGAVAGAVIKLTKRYMTGIG